LIAEKYNQPQWKLVSDVGMGATVDFCMNTSACTDDGQNGMSPVTSEYPYGINRKLITIAGSAGPQAVCLNLGLGYGLNKIPFGASWDLPSNWRR
jgi:hypothetical protein